MGIWLDRILVDALTCFTVAVEGWLSMPETIKPSLGILSWSNSSKELDQKFRGPGVANRLEGPCALWSLSSRLPRRDDGRAAGVGEMGHRG